MLRWIAIRQNPGGDRPGLLQIGCSTDSVAEETMKDQYAGDVSDVLKFAFLRALAGSDRRLGIAWYYVPGDDGRTDGRHLEWRDEPAWQKIDPELHASLSILSERSVVALERLIIWPNGSQFHGEPVPSREQRKAWASRKRAALNCADIVFLDPDNGLGIEKKKHATFEEVQLLRRPGRAIVFITFPGRSKPHDTLVQLLHERLNHEASAQNAITLRTNISVPRAQSARSYVQRQRWFTVVDPDEVLSARVRSFAKILGTIPRIRVRVDGTP
jgi:hypothetical protein